MATLIQIRRDTEANWTSNNPVLASGELALSTDQDKIKVGDGSSAWSTLSYINALPAEITAEISAAIDSVIDAAPGTLDTLNELAAAINDDASFYTTITNSISSSIDALDTDDIEEGLTNLYFTDQRALDATAAAYDVAGSASAAQTTAENYAATQDAILSTNLQGYADQAESDAIASANSYTDGEILTLDASLKSYADTAEADAVSTASADATSKANAAESNANIYTDNLIGDDTVDGTLGNTVTDRISTAVANLVDSAPGTLDTLNELAAALGDNPNFATSIATTISDGDSATLASAQSYADTAESSAVSAANSYTDTREAAITTAYQSYADTSEAEAITSANSYTDGEISSINTTISNLDTDNISEGSNLYFTNTRAQDATPGRVAADSTKPGSPSNGDGWLDISTGSLYIYINDGDSAQWVQV